jgi:hypothetical protein
MTNFDPDGVEMRGQLGRHCLGGTLLPDQP